MYRMKTLWVLAVIALLAVILACAVHVVGHLSEAHAATPDNRLLRLGTAADEWGNGHEGFQGQHPACMDTNPPSCPNQLKGTDKAELFKGRGGMEYINAHGGDDILHGGPDMDQISGGCGDDLVYGDGGHDHLGGDTIPCRAENGGDDYLDASDGVDEVHHIETAKGYKGNDTCVLDEDPHDGIMVLYCETVVLKDVPGVSGPTPTLSLRAAQHGGKSSGSLPGPGTYHPLER